jgi:hypothetical protein
MVIMNLGHFKDLYPGNRKRIANIVKEGSI